MGRAGWIAMAVVIALIACIGLATADSCNRKNLACFGSSTDK